MTPSSHPLDNPLWSSLTSRHAHLARRAGNVARYPAQVAPFAAIDAAACGDPAAPSDLARLMESGESVLFVGPAPALAAGWRVDGLERIAQMTCTERLAVRDGPPMLELSPANAADVLDLTARVYPHYFRPRTTDMGRYFGIYDGNTLAAITGERMRFDGHVELSAICTDPAYTGRGYAQRLVAMLTNDILENGAVAFLHVSHANARAKVLYEWLGFRWRSDIALTAATRTD